MNRVTFSTTKIRSRDCNVQDIIHSVFFFFFFFKLLLNDKITDVVSGILWKTLDSRKCTPYVNFRFGFLDRFVILVPYFESYSQHVWYTYEDRTEFALSINESFECSLIFLKHRFVNLRVCLHLCHNSQWHNTGVLKTSIETMTSKIAYTCFSNTL